MWLAMAGWGAPVLEGQGLSIACSASPQVVQPGEPVSVTARAVSPLGTLVHYSYSATGGAIGGDNETATLSTAGFAGRSITVTCYASDDRGHSVSAKTTVSISMVSVGAEPPGAKPYTGWTSPFGGGGHKVASLPVLPQPQSPPPPPVPQQKILQVAPPVADAYSLGNQVEAWKQTLKNGALEPFVPSTMVAGTPSTVEVKIHGYQDTQSQTPGAQGSNLLKVSQYMKVELLPVGSPGEFTITPQGNDAIQFVPNDGAATWLWSVTPTDAATRQQLQISVFLEYQGNVEQDVFDKSYLVNVNVQPLTTTIKNDYTQNPTAWFKYVLPGGAGFGAIVSVVVWLRSRRKKKKRGGEGSSRD